MIFLRCKIIRDSFAFFNVDDMHENLGFDFSFFDGA